MLTTTVDKAVAWAQGNSLYPLTFGLACCAIEQIHIVAARVDIARFGFEAFRASPRQADLIILSGRVSIKMAPVIRRIWDQMLEPKWAISMGALLLLDGRVQQLRARALGQVHADRRARAGLSASTRGADARDPAGSATRSRATTPRAGATATRPRAPRSCCPTRARWTAPTSACSSPETPPVPDATELELTAQELRDAHSDSILDTEFHRGRAVLVANPHADQGRARASARQGLHDAREPPRRRLLPARAAPGRALRDARPQARRPDLGQGQGLDRGSPDRFGGRHVPGRRLPRARGLRHVRRGVRGPSRHAPDPDARGLRGPPATARLSRSAASRSCSRTTKSRTTGSTCDRHGLGAAGERADPQPRGLPQARGVDHALELARGRWARRTSC